MLLLKHALPDKGNEQVYTLHQGTGFGLFQIGIVRIVATVVVVAVVVLILVCLYGRSRRCCHGSGSAGWIDCRGGIMGNMSWSWSLSMPLVL